MNNFVILSSHRVGSTLLRESLGSHSKLKVLGEFFDWGGGYWSSFRNDFLLDMGENPSSLNNTTDCSHVIENIFKKYNGFKIHRYQPYMRDYSDKGCQLSLDNPSWKYIADNSKIIFMYRQNKIKQFISLELALLSNIHHLRRGKDHIKYEKISINLKYFEYFLSREKEEEKTFLEMIPKDESRIIKISYEELTKDLNESFLLIQKFLNIEPETLTVYNKKLNNKTVEQSVLNYNELVEFVKNTEYEYMVYE